MERKYIFRYAAIISLLVILDSDESESEKHIGSRVTENLKLVIVVSRHGNIGGIGDYPGDKYPLNDTKFWPYGPMELTPYGRAQMFSLGEKVRSLYNGFLKSTYHPDDFYAASTVSDKVVISGDMFLAGLYPPTGDEVWYDDITWQPVPLYTSSLDNSVNVLDPDCLAFAAARSAGKAQFEENYAANISTLNQYINLVTKGNQTGSSPLYILWDKLTSERTEGYEDIPEWANSIHPQPLQDLIGDESIALLANTDEMVRLTVGNFFENMMDLMEGKINGSLSRDMYYYSGHESSIIGLQIILGIDRHSVISVVSPSSAMIFELHQNSSTSQYYLQVLYIDGNSKDREPVTIPVPNCGNPCEFYKVVSNANSFVNVDFIKECQLPSSHSTTIVPNKQTKE